jgi:hypothetical protein
MEEEDEEESEDGYLTEDSVDPDNMTYEVHFPYILLGSIACAKISSHCFCSTIVSASVTRRNCKHWGKLWAVSRAAFRKTSSMRFQMPSTAAASLMLVLHRVRHTDVADFLALLPAG